jgi:hypothetical protein
MELNFKEKTVVYMKKQFLLIALFFMALVLAVGCGNNTQQLPYNPNGGYAACAGLPGGTTPLASVGGTLGYSGYNMGNINLQVGFTSGLGQTAVGDLTINQQGGYYGQSQQMRFCISSLNSGYSQVQFSGNYLSAVLSGMSQQMPGGQGGFNPYGGGGCYGNPYGCGGQQMPVQVYIEGQVVNNSRIQGWANINGQQIPVTIQ